MVWPARRRQWQTWSATTVSCSPSWHPCCQVRLVMVTVIVFFFISFLSFLSLRSLSIVSNSHLLMLISIFLPHFPDLCHRHLLSLLSPYIFWGSGLFPSFSSPFFPHDQPYKTSSLQPPLSVRPVFSYPLSCDSSYPAVFTNLDLLLFSVSAIVSRPYLYAGVTHEVSTCPVCISK